jgi:transposase
MIVLGYRRRHRLEAIVRRATAGQALVLRAKIVLAAARCDDNAQIARDLGTSVDTVRNWRGRFRRLGMPGLRDRPRSGRPPVYGLNEQLLIVATVTEAPPDVDTHWTHRLLASHLHDTVGI